ncbi:choice-of-anchor B family protein [candidate division TA06 bacterium]|nr:choice-of-anchor B family protein [candidate division TA06 bacterium]
MARKGFTIPLGLLIICLLFTAKAQSQVSFNVTRLGLLPGGLRDCWGYVDTTISREFALICKGNALGVVDVTDPTNPIEVSTVPSLGLDLKDVKTYQNYAYAVNQSGPIQIIDLSNPDSAFTAAVFQTGNIPGAHNIYIDGHYAYLGMNGAGTRDLRILDLTIPLAPVEVGFWTHPNQGGWVQSHDIYVRNDTCFVAYLAGGVPILDVTDKTNPQTLAILQYPGNFTHNVWTTEDGRYLLTTDEVLNGILRIWDIQDLSNIQEVGSYFPEPNRVIHNVYVLGDFAYMSYYGKGVRIVDISDPTQPAEVGFYDTLGSTWGLYPFTPSGNIYVSDIAEGLFVLEFNGTRAGWVEGTVTDAMSGDSILGARIQLVENGGSAVTDSTGFYSLRYAAGNYNPITRSLGYYPDTSSVTLLEDSTTLHNIVLTPLPKSSITGRVEDSNTSQDIQATLLLYINGNLFQTTTTDSGGNYTFSDIWITFPPQIVYDQLEVLPLLPYNDSLHQQEILVVDGSPTILDFSLSPRQILLIDDDEGKNYENFYIAAIESLGLTYARWDFNRKGVFPISSPELFSRPMFWFTGDADTNTLTPADQESLMIFLDNGGKLFLTGQNIGEDIYASQFFINYLRASFVTATTNDHILDGVTGDPIGDGITILTQGVGGAGNQTSQDVIAPLSGAEPVFLYSPDSVAAIRVDSLGVCRVVYFAFGIEGIHKAGSFAGRDTIIARILNCFGFPVGIEEGPDRALYPSRFSLDQNSPNPFTHSSVVQFSLPVYRDVSLKIYDLSGRVVKTLINEPRKAGFYRVEWKGEDHFGRRVASGVYFYKIRMGDFEETKKMILLH